MDWTVERVESCDSTQELAHEKAVAGAASGTVIFAKSMDDGHGQHGRSWHAPQGGLYASIVLRGISDPRLLTLALGNAVADVLEVAGAEPQLKWVNDVFVADKKVAGLLVEAESSGSELDFMIAGIGINLNGNPKDWPHPLNESATTLEDILGAEICIEDVETYLLDSVAVWLERLTAGQSEQILAAWRDRDMLFGKTIGFDPDGDFCAKILGTANGITADGSLIIVSDDGETHFDSGSVFLQD